MTRAIYEGIKRMPSAQPERKKGRWVPHIEKSREYIGTVLVNVRYDYWLCDTCGYRVKKGQPMYNYCPNCGAEMEVDRMNKRTEEHTETHVCNSDVPDINAVDTISRQAAIDALWKALYEYEDKTEKQFIDSEELDVADWIQHRNFVQNMSDIDRQTILGLPSAQPEQKTGNWLPHWCEDGNKDGDVCSCCHDWFVMPFGRFPYCPNCGAKMEK